jgi:tetratricopeptide (TPR) repeat protein
MLAIHSPLLAHLSDRDQFPPLLALTLSVSRMGGVTVFLAVCLRILPGILLWALYNLMKRKPRLVREALELELAGRAAEAVRCCSKALAAGSSPPDEALLLGCLGSALMDMGRYEESQQYLVKALGFGDPTGSCRSSIAELFLRQGIEPDTALHLASQLINESVAEATRFHRGLDPVCRVEPLALNHAFRSTLWAQRAWALALLGRQEEAREAIDEASQLSIKPDGDLSASCWAFVSRLEWQRLADTCWLIGMALLAMNEADKASEQFKEGSYVDPKGKYGGLCRKQLALVGAAGPSGNRGKTRPRTG